MVHLTKAGAPLMKILKSTKIEKRRTTTITTTTITTTTITTITITTTTITTTTTTTTTTTSDPGRRS